MKNKKINIEKVHSDISDLTGINKIETKKILKDIFFVIKKYILNGNGVSIDNFGIFIVKTQKERVYYDKVTREKKKKKKRKVVKFKPCIEFKNSMKGVTNETD